MPAALVDALPRADLTLSSFNVLMPNSLRGWWIEKTYRPELPAEIKRWPHRREGLARVLLSDRTDIICLQEMCPDSFERDTEFLREAGYDCLLHRKFQLRVATFWLRDRASLTHAEHLDRVLVTSLSIGGRPLHIANCHLTAGPHPDRRLRQVHDALTAIARQDRSPAPAVVLCGDLNTQIPCVLSDLLLSGEVGPESRSPIYPGRSLTSRIRSNPFGPMRDIYADAAAASGLEPPPTFVVPRLYAWMCAPGGGPSEALLGALRQLYARFVPWEAPDIARWLTTINGAPDRGSEHDEVQEILAGGARALTEGEVLGIYQRCLRDGKLWSIDYDLHACGIPRPPPPSPPFESRIDYLFCSRGLTPIAARQPWSEALRRQIREGSAGLPAADHPSDHLPVAAALCWA